LMEGVFMKAVLMTGIGGPEVLRSSLREDLFLYVTVALAVLWESLLCPFASPCRRGFARNRCLDKCGDP
jgi:hypothetical protein